MKKLNYEKLTPTIIALMFIFIGAFLRLIPHPPNFAPILAIGLFAGTYLSRRLALFAPIMAMLISDYFIGSYSVLIMISVYGSFMLTAVLGFWLKKNRNWLKVGGAAIFSALLFYLITNFAVWAFSPLYTKDVFGLMQSYAMAIPFFKNTFVSNIFYTALFFGTYELVRLWVLKRLKPAQPVIAENDTL